MHTPHTAAPIFDGRVHRAAIGLVDCYDSRGVLFCIPNNSQYTQKVTDVAALLSIVTMTTTPDPELMLKYLRDPDVHAFEPKSSALWDHIYCYQARVPGTVKVCTRMEVDDVWVSKRLDYVVTKTSLCRFMTTEQQKRYIEKEPNTIFVPNLYNHSNLNKK